MSVAPTDVSPELKRAGRRFGYAFAIAINVVMLIIVQNILDWGWLPFLTDEFAEVVPWISFSLIVSIVVNIIYQFNDGSTVRSVGQIMINVVNIFVTFQIWQVYPFDFSAYSFDWDLVVRILLVVAMVGSAVGALVEAVKLLSSVNDSGEEVKDVHITRIDA